jgi:ketosteroid isomerase-like protein
MKNLVLIFALLALVSCNSQEKGSLSVNPNEALIKQYYAYFNQHDWGKMASMYTETADFKDPSLGKGIVTQTREQTIKKYSELNQTFPDLKDSITNIYTSGDKHIVVEFISTGTAPDKSTFTLPICTIFTIENGLISKDFTYYDNF